MNRNKLIKMFATLIAIVLLVSGLSRLARLNSMSLTEYAGQNGTASPAPSAGLTAPPETASPQASGSGEYRTAEPSPSHNPSVSAAPASRPTGAVLNGDSLLEQRCALPEAEEFYYEPLSDNLRRYVTGVSYPAANESQKEPVVTFEDLRYVHILHFDFEGSITEGELICNSEIAGDLLEIFYELYRNEYRLERVRLIDEYDGDDIASMEDNNTSCFNYRVVDGTSSLSKHAYGLAVDVNPFYNPYITYGQDGTRNISPASAEAYADRDKDFPYKIDEDDLCYKLFTQHGFTWGGSWNNSKDYQHFQKTLK